LPIVDIEIVLKPDELITSRLVSELADKLGTIFNSAPRSTWVKIFEIPGHLYAENQGMEAGIYPIFVSILKSNLPTPEDMQMEVEKITETIAQISGRPTSNVHIIYEPKGSQRAAFGGRLIA